MRSIFTKYIPPTNVRGSRYKAWDSDNHFKVTLSADDALSSQENHARVAQALKDKAGWKGRMICGDTNVGIVCIFEENGYKLNPISEKTAHKLRKTAPGTFAKLTDEEIKKAVKVPRKRTKKNPVTKKPGSYVVYTFVNGVKLWLTNNYTLSDDIKKAVTFSTDRDVLKVARLLKILEPSRKYFRGMI